MYVSSCHKDCLKYSILCKVGYFESTGNAYLSYFVRRQPSYCFALQNRYHLGEAIESINAIQERGLSSSIRTYYRSISPLFTATLTLIKACTLPKLRLRSFIARATLLLLTACTGFASFILFLLNLYLRCAPLPQYIISGEVRNHILVNECFH